MPKNQAKTISYAESIIGRLRSAEVSSAVRAGNNLQDGLNILTHQMGRLKTIGWQGETAWILDALRGNALDGLDYQLSMDKISAGAFDSDRATLSRTGDTARQALMSSPAPIAGAIALQKHLGPFTGCCVNIINQLRVITDGEVEVEADLKHETPKDSQNEVKKGLV